MAGIGNAGAGVTYFIMPALFDSLVERHNLTPHKAWRVAFVVPFILITATALGMIFLCEDTPTGPWAERHIHTHEYAEKAIARGRFVDATGHFADIPTPDDRSGTTVVGTHTQADLEARRLEFDAKNIEKIAESEVIQTPTLKETLAVSFSLQCLLLSVPYACSFGGELAINSILGAYYAKSFPALGQTKSGQWY